MQKFNFNWAKALMTVLMLGMIACGKDKDDPTDPDNSVPDPEGTLTYTLTNHSWGDGDKNYLSLCIDGICAIMHLAQSLNLYADNGSIVSLGKMSGLGNITKIPAGNVWNSNEAGASIYHGYIIKISDDVYYRVFISDWREEYAVSWNGSSYTRFYCTIKYQGPFTPAS
jgi:hypothetical protein